MRFGGLVAIDDLSFAAARGEITAIIGPNGAGKTTVFNCITGFYKPTSGRMLLSLGGPPPADDVAALTASGRRWRKTAAGGDLPPGAHARPRDRGQGPRRPHLPEHPPVLRHDGAGEPDRGAAQPADGGLGLDGAGPARRAPLRRGRGARRWSAPSTGSTRSASSSAPTIPPAICPTAPSGGSRSRAPCAPSRCCCASTSRRPASTRARPPISPSSCSRIQAEHGTSILLIEHDMSRGDGDLRPRRRAGVRTEDLRRPARARAATTPR